MLGKLIGRIWPRSPSVAVHADVHRVYAKPKDDQWQINVVLIGDEHAARSTEAMAGHHCQLQQADELPPNNTKQAIVRRIHNTSDQWRINLELPIDQITPAQAITIAGKQCTLTFRDETCQAERKTS